MPLWNLSIIRSVQSLMVFSCNQTLWTTYEALHLLTISKRRDSDYWLGKCKTKIPCTAQPTVHNQIWSHCGSKFPTTMHQRPLIVYYSTTQRQTPASKQHGRSYLAKFLPTVKCEHHRDYSWIASTSTVSAIAIYGGIASPIGYHLSRRK